MGLSKFLRSPLFRPLVRIVLALAVAGLILLVGYTVWSPGAEVTDGRHDIGTNGIWVQRGWLADDDWFRRNGKSGRAAWFRDRQNIQKLVSTLRDHRITDVFPHLCPADSSGRIPAADAAQTEQFLKEFSGFRVMPWIGGVMGRDALPDRPEWRAQFVQSVRDLLERHPGFHGVHLNIEPCHSGNPHFLLLLEDVRRSLPAGKILSVAAYPPPTRWHPYPEVHWEQDYFHQVAQRADQMVVMMYDTGLRFQKIYRNLMSSWTREVLEWSSPAQVLLGVPVYDDADSGYHRPAIENLENALLGIHSGLNSFSTLPKTYQGVALFCEWEMDDSEWAAFRKYFVRSSN